MFSPITSNMEERLKLIKESMSKEIATKALEKCESLIDFYHYANKVQNGVLAQMQLYILENYEKVPLKEWNDRHLKIVPHTGKEALIFGKTDEFKPTFGKISVLTKIQKSKWDRATKINSISFTLDEIDGDFSVKFNDSAWSFLWGEEVLIYYIVIKNVLEDENRDNSQK